MFWTKKTSKVFFSSIFYPHGGGGTTWKWSYLIGHVNTSTIEDFGDRQEKRDRWEKSEEQEEEEQEHKDPIIIEEDKLYIINQVQNIILSVSVCMCV